MAVSDDAMYAAATALAVAVLREDCAGDPELRRTMLGNYAATLQGNILAKLRQDNAFYEEFGAKREAE